MREVRKAPCPEQQLGRETEYDRAKAILNVGRHPTFIGRELVGRCARNGGLLFFTVNGEDAAVVIVNPKISALNVLCVLPRFRSMGVGRQIIGFLRPNFVRAVEGAVPYFERLGYVGFGRWKQGRTLRTRVMVRGELRSLSGRLAQLETNSDKRPCAGVVAAENLGAPLGGGE